MQRAFEIITVIALILSCMLSGIYTISGLYAIVARDIMIAFSGALLQLIIFLVLFGFSRAGLFGRVFLALLALALISASILTVYVYFDSKGNYIRYVHEFNTDVRALGLRLANRLYQNQQTQLSELEADLNNVQRQLDAEVEKGAFWSKGPRLRRSRAKFGRTYS